MQTRLCFTLLFCLPAFASAQGYVPDAPPCDLDRVLGMEATCLDEPETDRELAAVYVSVWRATDGHRKELLETAQRAWLEYREANCELVGERDREDLRAEALAECLAFMARERTLELRLISRLVGAGGCGLP
jgi:uncharacterized protein YecT (DUF1311 family)